MARGSGAGLRLFPKHLVRVGAWYHAAFRATARDGAAPDECGRPAVVLSRTSARQVDDLEARLAAVRTPRPTLDPDAVRHRLEGYLVDWRGLLRANVNQGQQVLRRLIKGRPKFAPRDSYYEFTGTGTVRPLISGLVQNVASPRGTDDAYAVLAADWFAA